MQVKTSELTGAALDWAVAKADGSLPFDKDGAVCWRDDERGNVIRAAWTPSTDWSQGGPIIKRELLAVDPVTDAMAFSPAFYAMGGTHGWVAAACREGHCYAYGPTPLIAAMRCYVASKLGDEIDIPEELL